MPAWDRTVGYAYTSFSTSSLASFVLILLTLRNLVLLLGFLEPQELGFCGFCRALLDSVKARCRRPAKAAPSFRYHKTTIHNKVTTFSTHLSCLFFLLYCIGAATVYVSADGFDWIGFNWCRYGVTVNMALYITGKLFLYLTITGRLYLAFQGSAYAYRNRTIYVLYAFVVATVLVAYIWIGIAVRGTSEKRFKKSIANDKQTSVKMCNTNAPDSIWVYGALVDLTLTIAVVYLFNSALKRSLTSFTTHLEESSRSQHKKTHAETFLLPLKYTTIATVAVLSTFVGIIFIGFSKAAFVVAIDAVVNCCALLLMTAKWKPVYVLLCTPLLRCVVRTPCLGCANLAELELIEETVEIQKTLKKLHSVNSSKSKDTSLSPAGVSL